jgi:hypothetical protein
MPFAPEPLNRSNPWTPSVDTTLVLQLRDQIGAET